MCSTPWEISASLCGMSEFIKDSKNRAAGTTPAGGAPWAGRAGAPFCSKARTLASTGQALGALVTAGPSRHSTPCSFSPSAAPLGASTTRAGASVASPTARAARSKLATGEPPTASITSTRPG